jgi:hypothetical protein
MRPSFRKPIGGGLLGRNNLVGDRRDQKLRPGDGPGKGFGRFTIVKITQTASLASFTVLRETYCCLPVTNKDFSE